MLVLAATAALTGCTGGSDEAAPIPTIELTTTTTEDPNLAEIRVVYEKFFSYLPTYGITVDTGVLEQFAADPVLTQMVETIGGYETEAYQVGQNDFDIHILGIEVNGSTATITSCDLDAVSLVDKDGEEIIAADEFRYLRTTELQLLDQGWRVTRSGLGEARTVCEDS